MTFYRSPLWLQVSCIRSADGTYGYRLHYLYDVRAIAEDNGYRTKAAAYSAGYRAKKRYLNYHPYSTKSGAPL
jgi:hypothetical protein